MDGENAKTIYNTLLKKKFIRATSEATIKNTYGIDLANGDWENIYSIPFKATIEVKLRSFQIKINHFCYQTNEQLHRHGQSETPYCYFCTIRLENTNHFLSTVHA